MTVWQLLCGIVSRLILGRINLKTPVLVDGADGGTVQATFCCFFGTLSGSEFYVGHHPSEKRQMLNQDGATRLGASRSASEAPKKTTEGNPMTNNSDAALRVLDGERE